MEPAELMQTPLSPYDLGEFFGGREDGINQATYKNKMGLILLEYFGVIPGKNDVPRNCEICNGQMRAVSDRSRSLGWRLRCVEGHTIEPTKNTYIANITLKIVGANLIIQAIHAFIDQVPVTKFMKYVNISSATAIANYDYCRDVAAKIVWHEYEQIGGENDVVEVDETHLFRKKYNRGRETPWIHYWVVGGVSRTTCRVFGVLVQRRSAEILIPILRQHINRNSYICTDMWRAYGRVDEHFNNHGVVNHNEMFLNPRRNEDPLWVPIGRFADACLDRQWVGPAAIPGYVPFRNHTQGIESSWRNLKSMFGTCPNVERTEEYIAEWMYRQNILNRLDSLAAKFDRFMNDIRRAYPGVGLVAMDRDVVNCQCHECNTP
ncbi:isxo2-like transposase domain [Holotrichia oblita]|uniref:Isxo2-like transposase domain n=1 Tax=Holotrichia oblita TaxID=644536 RepID=A0ACB9SXX7_HOLOL|nr:isxo2-like transposase domain [Holotrichia oblita]